MKYRSTRLVLQYIKSDLYRYVGEHPSFLDFIKTYFFNKSFKYSFWFRCATIDMLPLRILAILCHKKLSHKYHIQIDRNTDIGFGLYIGHHMCIVINRTAVIGNNCNISQFLTIGSNMGKAAKIGNNVYIGPNVCLVEDVTLGDNVAIGAGSVVVKNVKGNVTAAGNPAKVISDNNSKRFIMNPW